MPSPSSFISFFVLLLLILFVSQCSEADYSMQSAWPGICVTGLTQSPINVMTFALSSCPGNMQFSITQDIDAQYEQEVVSAQNLENPYKLSTISFT